jgi:hypothetical protein
MLNQGGVIVSIRPTSVVHRQHCQDRRLIAEFKTKTADGTANIQLHLQLAASISYNLEALIIKRFHIT